MKACACYDSLDSPSLLGHKWCADLVNVGVSLLLSQMVELHTVSTEKKH